MGSTRMKFALLLFVSLALLALVVGLVTTRNVDRMMDEQLRTNGRNLLGAAAHNLRERYRGLFLMKAVQAKRIRRALSYSEDMVRGFAEDGGDFLALIDKLRLYDGIDLLVTDDSLTLLYSAGDDLPPGWNPYKAKDVKGRLVGPDMLRLAHAGKPAQTLVKMTDASGAARLFFGHNFHLPDKGLTVGLWADLAGAMGVAREDFERTVAVMRANYREFRIGETGFLFIVDKDGSPVVSSAPWDIVPALRSTNPATGNTLMGDVVEHSRDPGRSFRALVATPSGEREAMMYADYVRPLGWYVASVGFIDEMAAPAKRLRLFLTLAIAAAAAVVILAALWLAGKVSAPLAQLGAFARQLPQTDFLGEQDPAQRASLAAIASGRRGDEVAELAGAFQFMDGALRRRIRELVDATGARERMAGELSAATEIQQGLLPRPLPVAAVGGRFALSGLLEPAREVGGDMYDYFMIDDDRLCLVIGDVSGKGVPAALFMSMALVLVRAGAERGDPPEAVVAATNAALSRDNAATMFITLFLAYIDVTNGAVTYVNAGHNPPLLRRASGLEHLEQMSGPVVGVFDDAEYEAFSASMTPGEFLFLYTDGVTEAMDADKRQFTDAALERVVGGCDGGAHPDSVLAAVRDAVAAHVGDAPAWDDQTMLCFTYNTARRRD